MTDRLLVSVAAGLAGALSLFLLISFLRMTWSVLMPKTYGPDTVPEIPEVPFSLRVVHEDDNGEREIREHDFVGRPDPSSSDFTRFAVAANSDDGSKLLLVLRDILPRMIKNNDGVPLSWEFQELPRVPKRVEPGTTLVIGTEDDDEGQLLEPANFRAPDGSIRPIVERGKFEAFEAGSSRRRLHQLMFEDETAKIQIQTVVQVMQDLFTASGGRPTTGR
jgi:hypothetical protein